LRRYLAVSIVVLSVLLLIFSCSKPKRTNPYDPGNPDRGVLKGSVTDAGGAPIPGVRVTTSPVSAPSDIYTDNAGNYLLTGILPGSYQAVFSVVGYDTLRNDITITAGQTTTLNAQLVFNGGGPDKGWIEGVILRPDNAVVEKALVVTSRSGFSDSVMSNQSGFYRIPSLRPDNYRVVVRTAPPPPGDSGFVVPVIRDTIAVIAGRPTTLNFTLMRWVKWPFAPPSAQGWAHTQGNWFVSDTIHNSGAMAYVGIDTSGRGAFTTPWPNRVCYTFILRDSIFLPVSPPPCKYVQVFFHLRDGANFYMAAIRDSASVMKLLLYKAMGGPAVAIDSSSLAFSRGSWHTLLVSYQTPTLELKVDGNSLITWFDPAPLGGGIGLGVQGARNSKALFDNVLLIY